MFQFYDGNNHSSNTKTEDSNVRYFEFELQRIDDIQGCADFRDSTLLNIKDVTNVVKGQQKLSDSIYQEAIENNYSHE